MYSLRKSRQKKGQYLQDLVRMIIILLTCIPKCDLIKMECCYYQCIGMRTMWDRVVCYCAFKTPLQLVRKRLETHSPPARIHSHSETPPIPTPRLSGVHAVPSISSNWFFGGATSGHENAGWLRSWKSPETYVACWGSPAVRHTLPQTFESRPKSEQPLLSKPSANKSQ